MIGRHDLKRLAEIWRYYQAGAVNVAVGFGLYSLLVWLSFNIFAAQIISHLLGMAFNYFTYSRHVFRDAKPAKLRFTLSYAVNYVVSLAILAGVSLFIRSPYLAGFVSVVLTSIINYFALKYAVFTRRAAP